LVCVTNEIACQKQIFISTKRNEIQRITQQGSDWSNHNAGAGRTSLRGREHLRKKAVTILWWGVGRFEPKVSDMPSTHYY
jgi:hypothetical protein